MSDRWLVHSMQCMHPALPFFLLHSHCHRSPFCLHTDRSNSIFLCPFPCPCSCIRTLNLGSYNSQPAKPFSSLAALSFGWSFSLFPSALDCTVSSRSPHTSTPSLLEHETRGSATNIRASSQVSILSLDLPLPRSHHCLCHWSFRARPPATPGLWASRTTPTPTLPHVSAIYFALTPQQQILRDFWLRAYFRRSPTAQARTSCLSSNPRGHCLERKGLSGLRVSTVATFRSGVQKSSHSFPLSAVLITATSTPRRFRPTPVKTRPSCPSFPLWSQAPCCNQTASSGDTCLALASFQVEITVLRSQHTACDNDSDCLAKESTSATILTDFANRQPTGLSHRTGEDTYRSVSSPVTAFFGPRHSQSCVLAVLRGGESGDEMHVSVIPCSISLYKKQASLPSRHLLTPCATTPALHLWESSDTWSTHSRNSSEPCGLSVGGHFANNRRPSSGLY